MSEHRTPAVELDHVSKSFGDLEVLRDVSLSVRHGEALCILGRSGTGKSVTLKLMIALLAPTSGRVLIDGDNISELKGEDLSRIRRKMGFLFQSAALFDSITLYENLALPLKRLTMKSKSEIDEVVRRVLGQVGLGSDGAKMPVELSGGMRKRAGLARALVLEPQILLVDEPSSGLDRITAAEIDDLLLEQKQRKKTAMVIVTHDTRGARRVGDRIAVLDGGELIALGSAEELQNDPHEVVRKLLGE